MHKKTLVISTEKRFSINTEGDIVDLDNTRSAKFWRRYHAVFDNIIVVGRVNENHVINNSNYVETENIKVFQIDNYQGLVQGLAKYKKIVTQMDSLLKEHPTAAFLLRLPGAIGNILGTLLHRKGIKYSIELVGDPYEVFRSQQGVISKVLAYRSKSTLKRIVRNSRSVAYVTEEYLQKRFPFNRGFQTYYSSIELSKKFLRYDSKSFKGTPLSLIGVGNLEFSYKGVNVLLDALNLLDKTGVDFELTWIGNGKFLEQYKNKAKEYDIDSRVVFLGTVPNDEIYLYFEMNNIFILPSLTEGLPRAMIEAMASRMICLGSDVGGIPELIPDECIFSSNDPESLKKKLMEVDKKFDHFKRFSEVNFNKAKEYLPAVLKERRIRFLKSIIS